MTTAAVHPSNPSPPSRVPTPRPKVSRTSSPKSEYSAAAPPALGASQSSASAAETGTTSKQPGEPRRSARATSAGPLSDKTTAFLIRRILSPQQSDKVKGATAPIEHLLPPLTSRNDVDLQLYALIAIILREFVQNWYAKITPDETFVAEIVQIIAHITRALEQRLRKVDLESLIFDELPELLDRHVTAYRTAHDPITRPPVKTDPREIYHALWPSPALSPVPRPDDPESVVAQAENEAAYRQLLVYSFLAVLLPTEDLENSCLTALVGQIFSELIIRNALINRLSEPWFVWELLIIASRTIGRRKTAEAGDRLGLSSSASRQGSRAFSAHALFWTLLQWGFLAASFIRAAFAALMMSRSLPPRTTHGASVKDASLHGASRTPTPLASRPRADAHPSKTPVVTFRCWSAMKNLAEVDLRMPWLCGAFSMLQWIAVAGPGRIAGVDGKLDRLLSYAIQRHVLDAANLAPLLRTVRGVLFPNNMPAGKPTLVAPASDAELRNLRRRCASALWALVPKGMGRLFFGGGLLRTNPVSRASREKTERSAELKTAAVGKPSKSNDTDKVMGRDMGPSSSSSSSSSTSATAIPATASRGRSEAKEGAPRSETAAPPRSAQTERARGQDRPTPRSRSRSRSGSPRSRRSAPAPRPNTGGGRGRQGQGVALSVGDLPPPPAPLAQSSPSSSVSAAASSSGTSARAEAPSTRVRDASDDQQQGRAPAAQGGDNDGEDGDAEKDDQDLAMLEEIERGILDVFSDAYCNKHLVYAILELLLVRLLPEMAEKGVRELWEERGVAAES